MPNVTRKLLTLNQEQGRAEREVWGGWNLLLYLTKCVGKISRLNVVGKFGVLCDKNEIQNSINIQSRRNQTVTGDDGF